MALDYPDFHTTYQIPLPPQQAAQTMPTQQPIDMSTGIKAATKPAVTSDRNAKINIKGVRPEIIEAAVAKLSAPRRNTAQMTGRRTLGR